MVLPLPATKPFRLGDVALTVQAKVVPVTPEVRLIPVAEAEQMILLRGTVVTWGVGLTVTTISADNPVHPFAVPVTWYVTDSIVVPELINVWKTAFPEPFENPVTLGELAEAVQVNDAPETWERTWTFVFCWEQMVSDIGLK